MRSNTSIAFAFLRILDFEHSNPISRHSAFLLLRALNWHASSSRAAKTPTLLLVGTAVICTIRAVPM